ncbi:hypothetical protein GQ54DRAFT_295587 [Martensiomyces pterosporus]|nr:hypothetical protein GQ54DRAFT_295587 [Martensiomyces pterosporus]
MYDSAINGHSYSTPSSPNAYTTQGGESKPTYDKELATLFRATAANVTQLYKEASEIGQTAYRAGYEQCYNDIWEFIVAAQGEHALSSSSEGQQQLTAQQLIEFARLKRIAPKAMHFATNAGRPSSLSGHPNQGSGAQGLVEGPSGASTPPVQTPTARTLQFTLPDNATPGPSSSEKQSETLSDHPADASETETCAGQANTGIDGSSSTGLQEKAPGYLQPTPRAKRLLESFDSMDVEPPKRRQRKEDIEMS